MEPIPDSSPTTRHHSFAKTDAAPPERTSARAVEMVEGHRPTRIASSMEILAAHLMTEPTPLREIDPQLPADLEEIILKCLRKDPASRYSDIRELEIALQSCAAVCEWNHDSAADWWSHHVKAI